MNIYEGSAAAQVRPIAAIRPRAKRNPYPGSSLEFGIKCGIWRHTGKAAGKAPGRLPNAATLRRVLLRFEDRDDLVRARVDDEDLVADQNVIVAAPLGIDHDDFHRQRIEMHA